VIIERVEIENILSHRLTRIDLPRGVVAIVGPNGAGKTSIVDSISYALFGTHSRDPQGKKRQALIRLGASRARVELVFEVDGRRYQVVREFSKAGSTVAYLSLLADGDKRRLLARTVKSVEAELAKLFGMPLDLAQRLYITRQGELDAILVDKSKRLDLLNSLLKLKQVETVHELLSVVARQLRRESELLEKQYEEYRRELERLEASKRELNKLLLSVRELERETKTIEEQLRILEEKSREAARLREEHANVKHRLESMQRHISLVEDTLRAYEERRQRAEKAAKKLEELRRTIEALAGLEEAHALRQRIKEQRETLESLRTQRAEIEERLAGLQTLEEKMAELQEARRRLELLEHEAKRYVELRSHVEDARSRLEITRKEIESLRRSIETEVRQTLGLEPGDPLALEERLETIKENIDRTLERRRLKKEQIRAEIAKLSQRLDELSNYLDMLTNAAGVCPLCRRPLNEEHRLQLIKQLKQEKKRVEADLQRLRREEALLEEEIRELEEKRRAVERLLDKLRSRYERLRILTEHEAELSARLEELNQEYLAAFAAYKEYEEARVKVRELEGLEKELAELKALKLRLEALTEEEAEKTRQLEQLAASLEEILSTIGISVDEVEEKLEQLRYMQMEAARLETLASELPTLHREVERLRSELRSLAEEAARLEAELRRLEEILASYEGIEDMLEETRRRYQELRDRLARERGRIEQLEKEVARLEALRSRVESLEEKLRAYQAALMGVERLRRAFGPQGLQHLIRVKARSVIEHHLRDMLSRFNLDFVDVRLGDDYEAIIVSRDGEKTVNMLSGGERVALAIAYRLALARAVGSRLGSLVMDEPTIHLDEERRRELINIIRYGLEATGLQQLIVITHDRELEEAADYVLEVRKENGVSRVEPREPSTLSEGLEAVPTDQASSIPAS